MKYVLSILTICLLVACTDESTTYDLESSIAPEILPYVLSFQEEAATRGIVIDWEEHNMQIILSDIETQAVGRCLTYTDQTRSIEIDETYWSQQNNLDREFVVYHELGHCILDRGHLDAADDNGRCLSIMHSSDDLCRNNYSTRTREALLDELFFNN